MCGSSPGASTSWMSLILTTAEPQAGESTHSASLIRGIAEGFRAVGRQIGGFDAYTASDVLRGLRAVQLGGI